MNILIRRYLCNELTLEQLTYYLNLNTRQQQYLSVEHSNYSTGEYKEKDLDKIVNDVCRRINNIN